MGALEDVIVNATFEEKGKIDFRIMRVHFVLFYCDLLKVLIIKDHLWHNLACKDTEERFFTLQNSFSSSVTDASNFSPPNDENCVLGKVF